MDPIILVPLALAVAWAASRPSKKTTRKPKPTPGGDSPAPPGPEDPLGPFDGPGGGEPWRPGGPTLPVPPPDGPSGPKPFPGPSEGPRDPGHQDPQPVEIHPGTTIEDLDAFPEAAFGLFISSDCETVIEGPSWWHEIALPRAFELVLGDPDAYHHPNAVLYMLLVADQREGIGPETAAQACIDAWADFVYGDMTPLGTYSGWVTERSDPEDVYWDYGEWFAAEYPQLDALLWDLSDRLYNEPELAEVFGRDWPADDPDGELDFDPRAA